MRFQFHRSYVRLSVKILGFILLIFLVIFVIKVHRFEAPLRRARTVAMKHERELHREAAQLIRDAQSSNVEFVDLKDNAIPHHISLMKPQRVRVYPHDGHVTIISRGDFGFMGLVLVDDPTTFSTNYLPTGQRRLSEFIWEFND